MNKIKFIIFTLVTFYSAPLFANTVEDELSQLIDHFLDGATYNNASVHDKFWADELVYTSSNGTRFGKQELMDGVMASGPVEASSELTIYSAEDMHIWQHDNIAVVTFTLVGTTGQGTGLKINKYLNSGTFVKRDNRWQAVNWQATIKAAD